MVTKKLLRDWNACWTDDRIAEHFGDRASLTPREIAADESILDNDRLWVMCQTLSYRNYNAAQSFAIDCVASVAHLAGRQEGQDTYARLLDEFQTISRLPRNEGDLALEKWRDARAVDAQRAADRDFIIAQTRWGSEPKTFYAWCTMYHVAGTLHDSDRENRIYHVASTGVKAIVWSTLENTSWDDGRWDRERTTVMSAVIQRALIAIDRDADGWVE